MNQGEFEWIRRLGRLWVLKAEMIWPALLVLTLVASVILPLCGLASWVAPTAIVLIGLSFGAALAQHVLFFSVIRCPECGYNPTRSKKGKRMAVKLVWSRLRPLSACSECGK